MRPFRKIFDDVVDQHVQSKKEERDIQIKASLKAEAKERGVSIIAREIIGKKKKLERTQEITAEVARVSNEWRSRCYLIANMKIIRKFSEITRGIQDIRALSLSNPAAEHFLKIQYMEKGYGWIRTLSDVEKVMKEEVSDVVEKWLQEELKKDPIMNYLRGVTSGGSLYLPR